jgi:hypothetical protein
MRCPTSTTSKLVSCVKFDLSRQITNTMPDLSWHKGIKNTGKDATVFAPQSDPNGLIQCTVTRKGTKSKL